MSVEQDVPSQVSV